MIIYRLEIYLAGIIQNIKDINMKKNIFFYGHPVDILFDIKILSVIRLFPALRDH